jgi:hypothetical protein
MSLAIDIDKVSRVLLADGWYTVAFDERKVSSFDLDAYEYLQYPKDPRRGPHVLLGGGVLPLVPSTGFVFKDAETKRLIYGPITAILAVEA